MLHTLIMAGGSGTRFWPQSRRQLPKQFLRIGTEHTLIRETADRCLPASTMERLWVVTGEPYAEETLRQLPLMPAENLLIEPCPRNTAPCIGMAALQMLARDEDATLLVVPADHVISPADAFAGAVHQAAEFVNDHPEKLVLFGVQPTYPATGFGYIQRGSASFPTPTISDVQQFREKPDLETAKEYLASADYFWNCGIFVWKARRILELLQQYQPEVGNRLNRLQPIVGTNHWSARLAEEFPSMPSISIDYAVLEQSPDVCMMPAPFAWDDVGSWQALARLIPPDGLGNAVVATHCGLETERSIIHGSENHLIATYGVRDLIIVQTPEVTLVAHRGDESAVKQLLAEVERRGLMEYL